MEQHLVENQADTPKPKGYSMVQEPGLGLTADESFSVFVPIRFTPMRIYNNATLKNSGNERAYDTTDKDRHLNSRVYNPIPYCKSKQPFTAVTVQKSSSTNTIPPETPVKRRRVIREAIVTGRKFKTVTPYRRPGFEDTTVKKECQDVEEFKPNDLPVKETTSLVKELTSPVKEITSPVKEITLPVKEITSPVKETTSPVKQTTSPVKQITSPVKEIPKTRTRHIAATWPNTGMVLQTEPPREDRLPKHVSPRFPVPFRKVTEYTGHVPSELSKRPAPELSKKPVKEVSVQQPELVTYPAVNMPNLSTDIQLNKYNAAGQVEKYYKHVLQIVEEIRKELEKGKAKEDGNDNSDQKDTVKKEKGTEKEGSCIADFVNESVENSSSTEENVGDEILSEMKNDVSVHFVNRYQEWKQFVSEIPMIVLLWLLWFLRRYLFLTFIMIRIFQ